MTELIVAFRNFANAPKNERCCFCCCCCYCGSGGFGGDGGGVGVGTSTSSSHCPGFPTVGHCTVTSFWARAFLPSNVKMESVAFISLLFLSLIM